MLKVALEVMQSGNVSKDRDSILARFMVQWVRFRFALTFCKNAAFLALGSQRIVGIPKAMCSGIAGNPLPLPISNNKVLLENSNCSSG